VTHVGIPFLPPWKRSGGHRGFLRHARARIERPPFYRVPSPSSSSSPAGSVVIAFASASACCAPRGSNSAPGSGAREILIRLHLSLARFLFRRPRKRRSNERLLKVKPFFRNGKGSFCARARARHRVLDPINVMRGRLSLSHSPLCGSIWRVKARRRPARVCYVRKSSAGAKHVFLARSLFRATRLLA